MAWGARGALARQLIGTYTAGTAWAFVHSNHDFEKLEWVSDKATNVKRYEVESLLDSSWGKPRVYTRRYLCRAIY